MNDDESVPLKDERFIKDNPKCERKGVPGKGRWDKKSLAGYSIKSTPYPRDQKLRPRRKLRKDL